MGVGGVAVGISLLSYIQAEIYVILHMYFRLMAALCDLPVPSTSESIHICSPVLLDLKNGSTRRKFGDNTFESRYPIYIRSDGRNFDFVWTCLEIL